MAIHDPQPVLHLLREHLAAHDKPLIFLFGAGTSSSVNIAPPSASGQRREHKPLIPTLEEMTLACREAAEALSNEHKQAWKALEDECAALELKPHIENILERLHLKVEAAGPQETTLGLGRGDLDIFEETIRVTIADLASPDEIPNELPHDGFSRWIRHARRKQPVEVFTTNYDVLIERSMERLRVPLFDGFVGSNEPFFSPDVIESNEMMPSFEWARLWKLHGSINWHIRDDAVIRTSSSKQGDMILPSHRKYDESRKMPYLALMDRLSSCLAAGGALIVTCGYSWNDQHINAVLLTGLENRPDCHAIAFSFEPLDQMPQLVRLARERDNLIVIGPHAGMKRGVLGEWALPEAIDKATASFLDLAFDSDAQPEEKAGPIKGRMRLVDFNHFCRFLAAMEPTSKGAQWV